MDLHVYKNRVIDWVIAASPEDAAAVCLEMYGDPPDDPHEWTALPDEEALSINIEDEGRVTKTCREWAAEMGRSFLASTET